VGEGICRWLRQAALARSLVHKTMDEGLVTERSGPPLPLAPSGRFR
jgi:hypothetical protein